MNNSTCGKQAPTVSVFSSFGPTLFAVRDIMGTTKERLRENALRITV